jgi:hypothetical protein
MRACANPGCAVSLDGRRSQAIYCSGSCRAAASRSRLAERAADAARPLAFTAGKEPHRNRTAARRRAIQERRATRAEEALLERLKLKYPDLTSEAA